MTHHRPWLLALLLAACVEDPTDDDDVLCDYDAASELCQQAFDCCSQFVPWAEANGYPGYDQVSCEPYTCITIPEERCQDMLDEAVDVENTFEVDFPDCS